ncbi:MAG: ABC transporter substrate-binding protein [Pseudomonadota bacterium]
MAQFFTALLFLVLLGIAPSKAADNATWKGVLADAEGQTVYLNAWGGDETINSYIDWIGDEVKRRFDVTLKHVKLADTAEAVARVVAEKTAGREDGGSIDLIWINGENFASMKEQDLLFGPFAHDLPSFAHVDVEGKPTTILDFTVPTDGFEAPWGMAQFVFFHDTDRVPEPPRSIQELLAWAKDNPGRFTHPSPPDFIGSTFLKHLMIAYVDDPSVLQKPVEMSDFGEVTAGLWQALEDVRPSLWRKGETYPANAPGLHQLLDDGEVDFSMAFNPAEASAAINAGTLPNTIRTFIPEAGSIGNTHFVAIPFNAAHKAGAQVVANFLMSPEAQAKKQDPEGWGDGTVLDVPALDPEDRARFDQLPRGIATLPPEELTPVLPEPHPSWMTRIEEEWLRRFSS